MMRLERLPTDASVVGSALPLLAVPMFPKGRNADVARLSPFIRQHVNMHGRYSFYLPDLAGGLRALRDPDSTDDEED
jgi:hypothetical protein